MYRIGSAARILKVVKLNGNNVNLIIQGIRRIRVGSLHATDPFMKASVTTLEEHIDSGVDLDAFVRSLINQFQKLVQSSQSISNDLGEMVLSAGAGDPARLSTSPRRC
jgi:ATP-dependent Lon protease